MTLNVQRTKNTNTDTSITQGIAVSSISVKVFDVNDDRNYIAISVQGAGVWVKLQAASVDNDIKGIFVPKCHTYELHPDNIYTGEISVIADDDDATVYGTEF